MREPKIIPQEMVPKDVKFLNIDAESVSNKAEW